MSRCIYIDQLEHKLFMISHCQFQAVVKNVMNRKEYKCNKRSAFSNLTSYTRERMFHSAIIHLAR